MLFLRLHVHKFTPFTRRRSHSRPRWFTPDIQHQLNCVHTTRRKARTKPTSINISKLNAAEHQLSANMQKAKLSFESSLLQNLKACGLDHISAHLLQKGADLLASPLTKLFQLSLSTGTLPNDWVTANIVPVYVTRSDKKVL